MTSRYIRRCPEFCHGNCRTCKGTGYIYNDGTSATAKDMLVQITKGKHQPPRRPTKFQRWGR